MNRGLFGPDLVHCRASMSDLLREAIATTSKLEQRLDIPDNWFEDITKTNSNRDSTVGIQIIVALLLRKARIHTVAAVRANMTSNLHSLAVQMRPVLECAGQVVFFFYHTVIAPDLLMSAESAMSEVDSRLNADFYQTFLKATRGRITYKELRQMATQMGEDAAKAFGMPNPKKQRSWKLRQVDKMTTLVNGREWYSHLSENFCHATIVDRRGLLWGGNIALKEVFQDQFTFLTFMNYLLEQVVFMNSAAALCPVKGEVGDQWVQRVQPALEQLRNTRAASKTLMNAARRITIRELDGENGIA